MTGARKRVTGLGVLGLALLVAACGGAGQGDSSAGDATPAAENSAEPTQDATLPADGNTALARLQASPRHGEWVVVPTGANDSVRAWVVYPERPDPAPVVVVVHEIFGLSHWVRAVADQLAAEGFIAIAPDLLTMLNVPTGADGAPDAEVARSVIGGLQRADIHRQLRAVAQYGMSLPAARNRYGVVGFCWGGTVSFTHAIESPELGAAVVYYGSSPATEELGAIQAPVLGLYGGNDARVNATIPPAETAMRALGKSFEYEIFDGAGHGFLRQQDGANGANLAASRGAWPRTIAFFRTHLEQ